MHELSRVSVTNTIASTPSRCPIFRILCGVVEEIQGHHYCVVVSGLHPPDLSGKVFTTCIHPPPSPLWAYQEVAISPSFLHQSSPLLHGCDRLHKAFLSSPYSSDLATRFFGIGNIPYSSSPTSLAHIFAKSALNCAIPGPSYSPHCHASNDPHIAQFQRH